MSRKNHKIINGRLLQVNKTFSQLKQKQKQKINELLYQEYFNLCQQGKDFNGFQCNCNNEIVSSVYEKIQDWDIWISFKEIQKYFYSSKNTFQKRYKKELKNKSGLLFK